MRENAKTFDPWIQTIKSLSALYRIAAPGVMRQPAPISNRRSQIGCYRTSADNFHVSVELVERIDACTATISWRDATLCCYVDQVWRASRSRVTGVCAMSGRVIGPNDDVFKPRRGRIAPLNDRAMILVDMLDEFERIQQQS